VHQGVVLECEPLPEIALQDIHAIQDIKKAVSVVVLDQVTDPHNIGAILRSAAAFGSDAMIVTNCHAPRVTATLARSASGAVEHVPMIRVVNIARCLYSLREYGVTCLGLTEEAETSFLELTQPLTRVALVLGAENKGLRQLTRKTCDLLVRLPAQGPILTLNVSNAAAIALFILSQWIR
jgi:23S rRNA (guanosine2251-2'-O)-methyltransferase